MDRRWAGWVAFGWLVAFGALHLAWGLGWTGGLKAFSTPSDKDLAAASDPAYLALCAGVAALCATGAVVALASVRPWGRRLPRWLVATPLWVACGVCVVRGLGNPVQDLLVVGGLVPFDPLGGPLARQWFEWMLVDAIVFSPFFLAGGVVFGLAARAVRHGDAVRGPAAAPPTPA